MVIGRVWLQTESDDMKYCYQLIKTMAKFEKETTHRFHVFIWRCKYNSDITRLLLHQMTNRLILDKTFSLNSVLMWWGQSVEFSWTRLLLTQTVSSASLATTLDLKWLRFKFSSKVTNVAVNLGFKSLYEWKDNFG